MSPLILPDPVPITLSRANGTDTITFSGIHQAWPRIPEWDRPRYGESVRTVPSYSGGAVEPGRTVRFLFGSDSTAEVVQVRIPGADATLAAQVAILAIEEETLLLSINGATAVIVCFEPGNVNPKFVPLEGAPGWVSIEMTFGNLTEV